MQKASYESDLTDEQWQALQSLLPKPKKTGRPPTCRQWVLNAILYVLRTGCQWTYLPKDFPPKSTVHGLFRSWTKNKIIESIHSRLRALARAAEGRRSRPTAGVLDSQTSHSAGLAEETGYDAGKKTKGRKRFLLVDTLGHVLAVAVVPANVPERVGAKRLLEEELSGASWLKVLYVDGGYSGADFAAQVAELKPSLEVEVVKRTDNQPGFKVVAKRWVVERTFGWLTKCRRLARDYERLSESVVAWIHIAMIRIMLCRLA